MKFMYLRGSSVYEIDGEDASQIAANWRVVLGWPIDPADLKPWLPEDERCAYQPAGVGRPCINPHKKGSDLCELHAAQSEQQELLALRQAENRRLDVEAEAISKRIEMVANVRAKASGGEGVIFIPEQARRLAEWLEMHQGNS